MPRSVQAAPVYNWFGDIRVRGQFENRDEYAPRTSGKIRVRLGAEVVVDPSVKAVLRLATTKSNRSSNQTLGDPAEPGSTRRYIGVDLAYAEWKPLDGVTIDVGRIPQLQIKPGGSQIIFDDDLALEGFGAFYTTALPGPFSFGIAAGSNWIRENYDTYYSTKGPDNMINWAQTALKAKLGDQSVQIGFGFYNFTSVQGMNFADLSVGGSRFGNTEKPAGVVKNEYLPREFFAEWKAPLGSMTSTVFAQHVTNSMTNDPHRAWYVGWNVSEKAVWDMQVAYASIESDAVPGIFTDSDFANGSTDSNGFIISSRWYLGKALQLRLTQYFNRTEVSTRDLQYSRTHLDLSATF